MPHAAGDRPAKGSVHSCESTGARLETTTFLREPAYPRLQRHPLPAARARRASPTASWPFEYISDPTVCSSLSKPIRHYCGFCCPSEWRS